MTAGIRRWTRRRQSHHLSDRMAAVWRHRAKDVGTVAHDLLGEDRFREMVAVALLLILTSLPDFQMNSRCPGYVYDGENRAQGTRKSKALRSPKRNVEKS
jgi:hypothetical protein